jgi:hypothetical protein
MEEGPATANSKDGWSGNAREFLIHWYYLSRRWRLWLRRVKNVLTWYPAVLHLDPTRS